LYELLRKEIKNLERIGSSYLDPILYLTRRNYKNDRFTYNRNIILNFSENGKHGCRFNCKFCSWKNRIEVKSDIVPTMEDIDKFCKFHDFLGYKVTISGGGEPLFNYDKNKEKLFEIIKRINKNGLLVDIITKELNVVYENQDLRDLVNVWSFSEEKINEELLKVLKVVNGSRISKIFNKDDETKEDLEEYINYYLPHTDMIYIREDFNKCDFNDEKSKEIINYILKKFPKKYNPQIVFLRNDNCSNNYFLINNKVYHGNDDIIHEF